MRLLHPLIPLLFLAAAGCAGSKNLAGTTPDGTTTVSNTAAAPDDRAALEARVRKLEEQLAKYAEALEFLGKVYDQQQAQNEAYRRDEPDPDAMFAVDISRDLVAGKVDGPRTAPVTIISVFDFACPYCHRLSSVVDEIVQASKGKVRVVYMDLVIHPQVASAAHHAACAAAKQGKYKEFRTAVWEKGFVPYADTRDASTLAEANLLAIAKSLRLDTKKLAADMHGAGCRKLVSDDMAELDKFKVTATPTMFINGTVISGALGKPELQRIVDEKLKIAEASGFGADYYDKVVLVKGEKQFKSAAD